jgi:hypothetical protein
MGFHDGNVNITQVHWVRDHHASAGAWVLQEDPQSPGKGTASTAEGRLLHTLSTTLKL